MLVVDPVTTLAWKYFLLSTVQDLQEKTFLLSPPIVIMVIPRYTQREKKLITDYSKTLLFVVNSIQHTSADRSRGKVNLNTDHISAHTQKPAERTWINYEALRTVLIVSKQRSCLSFPDNPPSASFIFIKSYCK